MTENYNFVKRDLHVVDLQEISSVIERALKAHFEHAKVSVVQCPDLTQSPFNLAGKGLGGSPVIADIGGVINMEFLQNNNKFHWNFQKLGDVLGLQNPFWIGAAATKPDCSACKDNSELVPNLTKSANLSVEAYVDKEGGYKAAKYTSYECSSLCTVFASEGRQSEVLKIELKKRIGDKNPVTCMRLALLDHFGGDQPIGLGGVLLVKNGKIKSHVMPSFPPSDVYKTDIKWLKYYEVPAPLICLSVLITSDKHNDDARVEHTHFFSENNEHAGHYHYDVTPDIVEYEGYYNIAPTFYRVARAQVPTDKT